MDTQHKKLRHNEKLPDGEGEKGMIQLHQGDCLEVLRTLPDDSVQCCVTSPPYWGLRDYGCAGQIGLEETLDEFLGRLVAVFDEVRRVLREDGVCWVNMGDSYAGSWGAQGRQGSTGQMADRSVVSARIAAAQKRTRTGSVDRLPSGIKPKDLVGQPWRLAFALQASGWWLRQDIIWHKPNPMPESVTDRCTKAHEYLFLLTKAERYFWNAEAMKEASECFGKDQRSGKDRILYEGKRTEGDKAKNGQQSFVTVNETRNRRSVWTIATQPYSEAHFATFPTELPRRCILASTKPGDTVLDPFGGSGTTGRVAIELGRRAVLIELNPEYAAMIQRRTNVTPGLPL